MTRDRQIAPRMHPDALLVEWISMCPDTRVSELLEGVVPVKRCERCGARFVYKDDPRSKKANVASRQARYCSALCGRADVERRARREGRR